MTVITEISHILPMLTILTKIIKTDNLDEIFAILKKDCGVKAMSIYETNGKTHKLKKFWGTKLSPADGESFDLKIQDVQFGFIIIKSTIPHDEMLLITEIIADKIKNKEFNQIMTNQITELQKGILTQDNENKMKTNFFASITHELRTPLNSIIGYSELLMQGLGGSITDKQKEFLLDIQTSGLNLLNIINDILDYSKINAGNNALNITEFDIEQVFFEVINTMMPLIKKKNIKLIKNIKNFTLNADYRKTSQILINLLSNAIKYSRYGDKIELLTLESNKTKIISIKDYGIGIPHKNQKKIFKAFNQAQNNKGKEYSTGLGLTIVKNFCDRHGWKIELESDENKGATFKIIIS